MILTCDKCGASYDAADLSPAQPIRCQCGDLLLVPEADAIPQTDVVERYVERWSSAHGLSAAQLAEKNDADDSAAEPASAWHFVAGSGLIHIAHDHHRSELAISATLMPLPANAQSRHDLCRRVLTLNLHHTGEARFALDRDQLVVTTRRPTLGLDFHEFQSLVECVARAADDFDDELREEFGNQVEGDAFEDDEIDLAADETPPAPTA